MGLPLLINDLYTFNVLKSICCRYIRQGIFGEPMKKAVSPLAQEGCNQQSELLPFHELGILGFDGSDVPPVPDPESPTMGMSTP
jgi:hypothetical protein